ncbi:MAG: efflux RND transporter permease subunit, partial [SAR324 cluster bacterium]|nr:efflux RND transporter permease subunit [SAR324 cluster bacterium]
PKEALSPLLRDLTVSPAGCERQIAYLVEEGFTFLFAREVEQAVREGTRLPEKSVAITLDDGYIDNFEQAYPILKKYGAKATIFMTTVTSVFGLMPLVLLPGAGSELYRGLGGAVLGGLALSTVVNIFFVPALFSLIQDVQGLLRVRESPEEEPLPQASGND